VKGGKTVDEHDFRSPVSHANSRVSPGSPNAPMEELNHAKAGLQDSLSEQNQYSLYRLCGPLNAPLRRNKKDLHAGLCISMPM